MSERFGIACLGITHPHVSVRLDVARRIDGIELVGVADPDPANQEGLAALGEHLGAPVRSKEELLADPAVHGVIIEPWTYEMVDLSLECAHAGKAVLVEKPAGSNPDDLDRLVEGAAGKVVQVGYNFRFSPMVDFAARMLAEGVLGKVVQARVHAAGPAGDGTHRWYNLPGDVGGCFWEDGCHIVDLIIHLFGMPNNATAKVSKFASVSGADSLEDAAVAALEYDDMLLAFDFTSWEANDWLETWEFALYGTKGTLFFRVLPETYELYLKADTAEFRKGWTRWNQTTFAVPWADEPTPWEKWHVVANKSFFFREIAAFRAAARGEAPVTIPPAQARDVAIVMEACYESSRAGGSCVTVERR